MKAVPPDQIKTKADERAIELGYYWDDTEAIKVKNFVSKYCPQSKGGWSGCITVHDFQYDDIILPFYSWYRPDGTPRYSSLFCLGPRKWGKSFLGAALAAYHLVTEPRSEVLCLASTVKQAKIIFSTIANFDQNPTMKERLHVKEHVNEIRDRIGKGKLSVLSSTAVQGASGWNTSCIVADEYMEWRASIATSVWGRIVDSDMARLGGGGRKIVISTPQDDLSHPGKTLIYDHAMKILDGSNTDDLSTLPVIYGAPSDADPGSPETWAIANPGYDVIVPASAYEAKWNTSKDDPHKQAQFRCHWLGQWVGSVNSFINPQLWHSLQEDFTESDLLGKPCIGGIDWGGRYDLNAVVWLFLDDDDRIAIIPRFYLPQAIIERKAKQELKDYWGWASAGCINVCSGETIDMAWWQDLVQEDIEKFSPHAISIDPYNMESQRQWMEDDLGQTVIEVQANSYQVISPLCNLFEKFCKDKKLKHNGHPVLDWNVENLSVKTNDNGLIRPEKLKGAAKIDGAASLITALEGYEALTEDNSWCGIL